MQELKDFTEQIKNGHISVIDQDNLIIENYPCGFKCCEMTFKKANNRNGQIISRTSLINGKVSKPKKTTACRINIFVYDAELKRHFILRCCGTSISIDTTAFFNANGVYKEHYFDYVNSVYTHELHNKKREEYNTLIDFLKPYLKYSEEGFKKLKKLNGG